MLETYKGERMIIDRAVMVVCVVGFCLQKGVFIERKKKEKKKNI